MSIVILSQTYIKINRWRQNERIFNLSHIVIMQMSFVIMLAITIISFLYSILRKNKNNIKYIFFGKYNICFICCCFFY